MDERAAPDSPSDASAATRDAGSERGGADDGAEDAEPSGPLARVRSVGAEAVGVVVDAALDAL